jgi:pantetheine-phosphate adenylyltransferase
MKKGREIVALYPGSFDPITHGHEELARRALAVADRIVMAVAYSSTHEKQGLFGIDERVRLIEEVFADEERIEVKSFQGLLVDFAREEGASVVIRGLRAVSDFEYELQMAQMNRELWGEIETIFLVPDVRYSFLSASLVREVARLGGDVSSLVSKPVLKGLKKKLKAR